MELGLIRQDLDTFRGRMTEVEQWVCSAEVVQRELGGPPYAESQGQAPGG